MSGPIAHSKLGASSMYRWEACPGSVRMSEGIESKSSIYADEGIQAHEIASERLLGRLTTKPHNISKEMWDATSVYVDTIRADIGDYPIDEGHFMVEHRFDLSEKLKFSGLFGTADGVLYQWVHKLLRVYDYKHGAGIPVEVEENSQLMYYGLGALLSTGFPCEEVELVIVQPRCHHPDGPVRRWRFPAHQMLDFASRVVEAATRTQDSNAPLSPGDHCKFCPAAGICPALHEDATALAKEEFGTGLTYDPRKLAEVLDKLPIMEAFIKGVREFAYGEALHGRTPPGWKLVEKRATRRWISPDDAVAALVRAGVSEESLFDKSLKSPAQVEKTLTKEQRAVLASLVAAISSGQSLVSDSDKRPALKNDAASEFGKIEKSF